MSRPPLKPEQAASGIAVDPQTLERVIPESKRPDGTVRKQIRVRPGFTPQEDVRRFRGTRQAQMDANALPKGHIIGWAPPPQAPVDSAQPMSKSAKKNAKRRGKKQEAKKVVDNWEDDDDEDGEGGEAQVHVSSPKSSDAASSEAGKDAPTTNGTKQETVSEVEALSHDLMELHVK